jgi:glycosyltransferase involved in cell wall biosynthesis
MDADRRVMVVIPAFNEGRHIEHVVRSIPNPIDGGSERFTTTVVVVDDCSTDGTQSVAEQAGATVLRHVINSGAGAATRTGLRYAEQHAEGLAYVVTMDADGQHVSDDVVRLVQFATERHTEMVIGNRLHAGNREAMPRHRTVGNKGLNLISRLLFGIKVKDTQSGLRLFTPRVLPLVSDFTIDRYGFCTEMLWLARRSGIDVAAMPISVKYSSETLAKGQSNWGVIDLVLDLFWIRISR